MNKILILMNAYSIGLLANGFNRGRECSISYQKHSGAFRKQWSKENNPVEEIHIDFASNLLYWEELGRVQVIWLRRAQNNPETDLEGGHRVPNWWRGKEQHLEVSTSLRQMINTSPDPISTQNMRLEAKSMF